ncbi:MAG TPA: VWA domain-containing protein [Myxococcaceae bacterium]|nr:VWA domain-containing protein [Myxococcaceae bacterium]
MLQAAALALAVVALARPQLRDARAQKLSVEGIDVVIALDLSTSMEAGDFRPNNRLFVARQVLTEFLDARVNDRVGLVVFAGAAYTQAPLTLDYGVVKDVVRQLRTRVLEDGTAIGDALAVSLNRLRDSDAKSRVVILITDGDNNAGKISPLDAAAMAKNLKIPIFTLLVGKGGKVPFPVGQDLFGNTAWREMEIPINPALLKQIAQTTGGEAYRATDRAELKAGLERVLGKMERSKIMEGGAAARVSEQFHLLLLGAFVLAAADLLLRNTLLRVTP